MGRTFLLITTSQPLCCFLFGSGLSGSLFLYEEKPKNYLKDKYICYLCRSV